MKGGRLRRKFEIVSCNAHRGERSAIESRSRSSRHLQINTKRVCGPGCRVVKDSKKHMVGANTAGAGTMHFFSSPRKNRLSGVLTES